MLRLKHFPSLHSVEAVVRDLVLPRLALPKRADPMKTLAFGGTHQKHQNPRFNEWHIDKDVDCQLSCQDVQSFV